LALLVRIAYLIDSANYPAFSIPISDAHNYDECARQWLRGGGMSTQFFWQSFCYPLFLTCVYTLSGGAVLAAKVLQAIVGAATCALTYRLGERLFGRRIGIAAGLITALYGPLIFYDGELLPMGWAVFWAVALLSLCVELQARAGWRGCLGLGVVGALTVLTRAEFLLFFLAAWAWLAWRWLAEPPGWRGSVRRCAIVGLGLAAVALPVAIQNARVTGHFGFLPAAGGINIYIGNHPETDRAATAVGFEWDRLQRMPEAAGIRDFYGRQSHFYEQTWKYVRNDPAGLVARLLGKAVQFVTSREIPRSADVYAVRPWSLMQMLLTWKVGRFGFPFGVLLPLAVVGLMCSWRQLPVPVALFLVLCPLAVILVFVTGPYRLPIVPVLAILAAAGAAALGSALRQRRWRFLALNVGAVAAAGLASTWPGPFPLEREDFESGLCLGLGHHYARVGDPAGALKYYAQELSVHPDSVPAHSETGRILLEQGRIDEAMRHCAAAVRARPDLAATHDNYGLALREAGRLDQAADEIRAAIALEPTWAKLHSDLGFVMLKQKRYREATIAYQEAVRLAPQSVADQFNLGIALAEQRQLPQALIAFREARRLAPNDIRTRLVLGMALEDAGQTEEATQEYQAVLRIDPSQKEARQRLQRAQRRLQAP
jgi:tetratricopeptide (TPR) repeat protein